MKTELDCRVSGCPVGQICLDTGVCGAGEDDLVVGSGGNGQAPPDGTGGSKSCLDVEVSYETVIPTVSLLIDRSSSMMGQTGNFGVDVLQEIAAGTYEPWGCPTDSGDSADDPDQKNPEWRWNVVRNVLFNPQWGAVPAFQDQVRFGMTLFTHQPDVDPNLCPELIVADFALGNSDQLLSAMLCSDVGRFTPTRESLAAAAQNLHDLDVDGPKVIIMATDGSPTTCACTDFRDELATPEECRPSSIVMRDDAFYTPQEAASVDVIAEARRIHDEWGIQLSVIDVSSADQTTFRAHLQEVATAGGGKLYDGLRPAGLSEAFFSSVEEVRSCEVDLQGEIVEGFEDKGTVTLDGDALPISPAGGDGYRVVSPSRIELLGEACDLLKQGDHQLSISFPCETFVVIR